MPKQLKIRDLTLRDGQQSQFATRMSQAQVDRVLPLFREAGFYAMEVWGGAVPDSVMRYLDENPWERLESIKAGIGGASRLTALSRGRNLFGYNPYPDSVIEGFCRNAVGSGIDIMRIFDALNDIENMKSSIRFVKEAGGMADCAVCFTMDPKFSTKEKALSFLKGRKLPRNLFTIGYYVEKAKALEALGADMISIKDMAGLVDNGTASALIRALKQEVGIPIDLHTHCTPGYGVASSLAAMAGGVDILDTTVLSFSGGPAAPAYEIVRIFADKMGIDTGVDSGVVARIDAHLREIRLELSKFDQFKRMPPALDLSAGGLSKAQGIEPGTERLFDYAIEATVSGRMDKALEYCRQIEKAFNYPDPDEVVRHAQIPGGMYTNMIAQLQEAKLGHLVEQTLRMVPEVRLDCGVPPLVTPTSQIVGVQAVNCVIAEAQGLDKYSNVSKNFAELVKGSYGTTPWPVDPEFRLKICGTRDAVPYDTSAYRKQENPAIPEAGGLPMARDEKDGLLLELFPSVATKHLRGRRIAEWRAMEAANLAAAAAAAPAEPEPPEPLPPEFWAYLTDHIEA